MMSQVVQLAIQAGSAYENLVKMQWSLATFRTSKAYQSLIKLRSLWHPNRCLQVGLVAPHLFDFGDAYEIVDRTRFNVFRVEPAAFLRGDFPNADVLIIRSAAVDSNEALAAAQNVLTVRPHVVTCCWGWDHHHLGRIHALMSIVFDFFTPLHESSIDYLRSAVGLVTRPVWGFSQFTNSKVIDALASEFLLKPRSDALYGHFTRYGVPRDALADACQKMIEGVNIECKPSLDPSIHDYFKISESNRFADWSAHKVSLNLSINNDVPLRIFDALLTGQIPLVSRNVTGFERLFSEAEQQKLPILRFSIEHPTAIKAAWHRALMRFNNDGTGGIHRRYECARRHHLLENRLKTFFDIFDEYAEEAATL